MAEDTAAAVVAPAGIFTEDSLMSQLDIALKAKDFKAVAKASGELVKFQKAREAAELEVKQKALEAVTKEVMAAIVKAVKPFVDAGKLDDADGIWYANDFGEAMTSCRLMKSTPRKARAGGGNGGGGKFAVSTNDLLEKFGSQEYKDGVTFAEAYEADTDKNKRFAIRTKLLKLGGYIT